MAKINFAYNGEYVMSTNKFKKKNMSHVIVKIPVKTIISLGKSVKALVWRNKSIIIFKRSSSSAFLKITNVFYPNFTSIFPLQNDL